MGGRMTLPTAVAISGAAANPNAGVGGKGLTTNPLLSLIMAFLNLRLGYWVPNPSYPEYQNQRPDHCVPGLYQFWRAFDPTAGLTEMRPFIQISDGGHFENLALYELIRRRMKVIICCDAGADPDYGFGDLLNAMDKVCADFGAVIEAGRNEFERIIPDSYDNSQAATYPPSTGFAQYGHFLARIRYADGSDGLLVFMKTTVLDCLSVSSLGYKMGHPLFPDETTIDQFFSEEQFDAYRDLGFCTAERMLQDVDAKCAGEYKGLGLPAWLAPSCAKSKEPAAQ